MIELKIEEIENKIEQINRKKLKTVCSVTVSRLVCFLSIADQLQPNFYKLPCLEQRITKRDWKSTIHSVAECP